MTCKNADIVFFRRKPIVDLTKRPDISNEQQYHSRQSGFKGYVCPELTFGNHVKEVTNKIHQTAAVLKLKHRP